MPAKKSSLFSDIGPDSPLELNLSLTEHDI